MAPTKTTPKRSARLTARRRLFTPASSEGKEMPPSEANVAEDIPWDPEVLRRAVLRRELRSLRKELEQMKQKLFLMEQLL